MILKEERYQQIIKMVNEEETVTVNALADKLGVAKMTIRRDLDDLERRRVLLRIHGGAQKIGSPYKELSHNQKRTLHVSEKQHIAQKCAALIHEDENVFLGPGTTNEMIFDYLDHIQHLDIVTNAMTIFERFKEDSRFDLLLIGGRYRRRSGTCIGYFANKLLNEIKVSKAFIGTNGISGSFVTTANEEEGNGQQVILNNAAERYVVADHSKIGVEAFYRFYEVEQLTAIITDPGIDQDIVDEYRKMTRMIY